MSIAAGFSEMFH